jgi:hypothetical protein
MSELLKPAHISRIHFKFQSESFRHTFHTSVTNTIQYYQLTASLNEKFLLLNTPLRDISLPKNCTGSDKVIYMPLAVPCSYSSCDVMFIEFLC